MNIELFSKIVHLTDHVVEGYPDDPNMSSVVVYTNDVEVFQTDVQVRCWKADMAYHGKSLNEPLMNTFLDVLSTLDTMVVSQMSDGRWRMEFPNVDIGIFREMRHD